MGEENYNYEDLFELSPDLFCIVSLEGYFKKVNSSVLKLLGYSSEELYAKPINDFLHADDVAKTNQIRKSLISGELVRNFENRYITKKGDIVWLSWTAKACLETKIIFAVAKDITESKRIDLQINDHLSELTAINKKYKNLSYTTAHDLRPPIDNLISIINLIENDIKTDSKVKKLFELLDQAVHKLKDKLNEYIDDLKQSNLNKVEVESIKFKSCWTETLFLIRNLVEASDAIIETDFEKAPTVTFNKDYLKSIFLNLVSNSIKYAKPGIKPKLLIQSHEENGNVHLTFEDNGQGLDTEKVKDKIFGLHQTFHENADSKGIGLYLVHTHVTSLGGSISVESEPNKGAKFTISFGSN